MSQRLARQEDINTAWSCQAAGSQVGEQTKETRSLGTQCHWVSLRRMQRPMEGDDQLKSANGLHVFSEKMNHGGKEKQLVFTVTFCISRKISTQWS